MINMLTAKRTETGTAVTAEPRFSRNIPYTHLVDERTVALEDDSLVQIIRLRGVGTQTANAERLLANVELLNAVWQQVCSPDFALWVQTVKSKAHVAPQAGLTGFAAELEQGWCHSIDDTLFDVAHYVSVVWRWPRLVGKAMALARKAGHFNTPLSQRLARLSAATRLIARQLNAYEPHILGEREQDGEIYSEPLEFLASLINAEHRPMLRPRGNLQQALPCAEPFFGKFRDRYFSIRGSAALRFGAVLSLQKYQGTPRPGRLDAFLGLPYELVVTHSFGCQDATSANETLEKRFWHGVQAEEAAVSDLVKIDDAKDEVASGKVGRGFHQMTCTVYAPSLSQLSRATEAANEVFSRAGLFAVHESLGLETQWWSQLPGNDDYAGRNTGTVSTANLACYAPLTGFRTGSDQHHWGAPVCTFEALHVDPLNPAGVLNIESGTKYPFGFHVRDVGHALVVAGTGIGKTVLLTTLFSLGIAKLGMRGRYFDRDLGAKVPVLAMGGKYDVLSEGVPSGSAPTQLPDTEESRAYLRSLCALLVTGNRPETLSIDQGEAIKVAVEGLYSLRQEQRTFTALRAYTAGKVAGEADPYKLLSPWCDKGEFAWVFDNPTDSLQLDTSAAGWDFTAMKNPRIAIPMSDYMFYRVKQDIKQGTRTGLMIDEGWQFLDMFPEEIPNLLVTIRKDDGFIYFATNKPKAMIESVGGKTMVENIKTKWFLPNVDADPAVYCDGFGVTEQEHAIIKGLPGASRCMLLKQGDDSTVVRMDFSGMPDILNVLSRPDHATEKLDELIATYGSDPKLWLPHYYNAVRT